MPTLPPGFRVVQPGQQPPQQQGPQIPQITVRYADPPADAVPAASADIPAGFRVVEQPQAAPAQPERPSFGQQVTGASAAWLENLVSGVPVAGPALQAAGDYIGTTVMGAATGQDPAQMREDIWQRRDQRSQEYPLSAASGMVTGAVASMAPIGATAMGAQALGITGPTLPARMAASGTTSGLISAADSAAREGLDDPGRLMADTAIGTGIGAAIPGVGAGLGALGRNIGARVSAVRGAFNPAEEAGNRVSSAVQRDMVSGAPMLSAADEAAARLNNQPLLNVDRGGETTRGLMRAAANQSPEARATVENVVQDRFGSQSSRVQSFFNRIMGGDVNNLTRSAEIASQARQVNSPAYRRAFTDPRAQGVWNEDLQGLLQSDAIQRAISDVGVRGSNRSALSGDVPIRNPFTQGPDGRWQLTQQADDSIAIPNLTFWDQVKRNLDSQIGLAQRSGDRTLFADLTALKQRLTGTLDELVPSYGQARAGAAAFFDAEDALQAGRNAWAAPKQIDESRAAFGRLSDAEKKDFGIGLVSQIMDDIRSVNNRSNLMRYFDTPARKEILEMALGPQRAREMEAFVRVEDIMDRARGALGNSTTARQLVEMGLTGGVSGGAAYLGTGDIGTASAIGMLAIAGRRGAQAVGRNVDNRVLQEVARILSSGDDAAMAQARARAANSQQFMQAIESIQRGLGITARGTALAATQ